MPTWEGGSTNRSSVKLLFFPRRLQIKRLGQRCVTYVISPAQVLPISTDLATPPFRCPLDGGITSVSGAATAFGDCFSPSEDKLSKHKTLFSLLKTTY